MPGPAWGKTLSKEEEVHRLKEKEVKGKEKSKDTMSWYAPFVFILVHINVFIQH